MEAASLIVGVASFGFGLAAWLQMRADRAARLASKRESAPWAYPPPPARILELQTQRQRLVMKHAPRKHIDEQIRAERHAMLRREIRHG